MRNVTVIIGNLPLDLTIAEYMLIAMKIAWEAGVYEASFEEWI